MIFVLYSGFAIVDGLFDIPNVTLPVGAFFADAYGILAFAVPSYCLWGAILLIDPAYKPAHIFTLGASLAPFVTLAIGYNYFHLFDELAESSDFLRLTGRVGYICIILFCILIELIAILILNEALFQKQNPDITETPESPSHDSSGDSPNAKSSPPFQSKHSGKSRKIEFLTILDKEAVVPEKSGEEEAQPSASVLYDENDIEIDLPSPKPLSSAQAFNELKKMIEREKSGKHGNEDAGAQPAAYVDIPDIFEDKPEEITDGAVFPEKRSGANDMEEIEENVQDYEQEERSATTSAPSAHAEKPRTPAKPAPLSASPPAQPLPSPSVMYVDIPIPFDYRPEEITDDAIYPQKSVRPVRETRDRETEKAPPPETPSAYVDLPEPFEYDPDEITGCGKYSQESESGAPKRNVDASGEDATATIAPTVPSTPRSPAPHAALQPAKPPIAPRRWKTYQVPTVGILNDYPDGQYWIIDKATQDAAETLKRTLNEFKIHAEVTGIRKGPVITMFEILPAPGVKLSKIVNLQDNIALRLAAQSVRIVAPIPGKHAVGIEVPNAKRNIVSFAEIIEDRLENEHDGKRLGIPVVLGKDITGEAQTVDLTQMPHLLIAGATGSGKSVCVNALILSILYQRSPSEVRLILIDPKIVELKLYNDIPHLLTPVITEPKKAFQALQYCICEMERRYACLDSMGVRDIKSYNRRIKERNIAAEHMPYIVVVIDEFADLMATTGKELESTVARLAAMSRAVGIHLVLATQRPSIDVITGLIKANIPSRIAFMVASKMDSRIIIDMVGAEKLLGKGDMLYAGVVDPFPIRMQGAFISEEEVERVVEYVKTLGEPDYIDEEIFFDDEESVETDIFGEGEDPLYEKAWEIVAQQGKASASYIQRRLKIGYNRAARLVEVMEQRGLVGPAQGSKPRELLRGV
ncbi:MAG: DNA translocase FtsK [Treponema sp.]|nr:DNA translocase FtsK [Treponema sp.]